MGITVTKELVREEFDKMRRALEKGSIPDVAAQIQKELDLLDNTKLNIAITGVSGTGKSSLVNALRGIPDHDKLHAAKVGVVETTKEPEQYQYPTFSNVVVWDLPGIGTPNFEPDKYLKEVNFSQYDFFIIIAGDRFTIHDAKLAYEIRKMEKKFYFVRTQIDISLMAEERALGPTDFTEESVLENIRENCHENLKKAGETSPKVFLLSSWFPDKYDFPLLQEALCNDLDDIKRQVLIMAMPAFSKEALEKKKAAMEDLIWKVSLTSCVIGAIPVPGLSLVCDVAILLTVMKSFCCVFGLDEKSLKILAERVGKPVAVLKSAIKRSAMAEDIKREFIFDRMTVFAWSSLSAAAELLLDFIPIVGSVTGAGLSLVTTYYLLKGFLKDVMEDAERVAAKVAELSKKSPK